MSNSSFETAKVDASASSLFVAESEAFAIEAVDLGLPSGLKWANANVGATSVTDGGLYFAWGETIGYTADIQHSFNWQSYKWTPGGYYGYFSKYNTTRATLDLEDDAAHVNMGGNWRMPTKEEAQELLDNTTQTWTDDYEGTGVAGYVVTSKTNGNSIFMPAAGSFHTDYHLNDFGLYSRHWLSSQGESKEYGDNLRGGKFAFSDASASYLIADNNRFCGYSVRGVCE